MAIKKYAGLETLQVFLDECKSVFANISHKHSLSDITDHIIDSELSSTSTNPVQNKVINEEFDAVSEAMGALELSIDSKADQVHSHDDIYYTEIEVDSKLADVNASIENLETGKSNIDHMHTIDSIDGLQEAVSAAADSKFYVVTFDMGDDREYHADLTFAEIREKFEAGGNMVARIDGTDYIPLLSAAPSQIIFSGIYKAQSVSLTVDSKETCTLITTQLSNTSHGHTNASTTSNGFMSPADKVKLDSVEPSTYETKEDAQAKYDEITEAKADWNQNDANAVDYIKNRPFYEYAETILAETTVNNGDILELNLTDYVDNTVTVIWDGVSYEQTVSAYLADMWTMRFTIGNESYLGNDYEDTGEEYLIDYKEGSTETTIYCDSESHTLSINKYTLVKIDNKFLPDDIAHTSYVDENFVLKSDLENIDLSDYETTDNAQLKLEEAKAYADNAAAQKSLVQIITWEADD